jgi:hypothetical protein
MKDWDVPMVSSTSAARGAVVAKARALGTRRDRAAARNSCGRIIVATVDEGGEGGYGEMGLEEGGRSEEKELFRVGICWVT